MSYTSLRILYMGRNPGKKSRTGREVQERMRKQGLIRGNTFWCALSKQWWPISRADMGHIEAAVLWWNKKGYKYGAKSKKVRDWMLNPNNYRLEERSANRSHGALLRAQGITYRKPRV